MQMAQVMAGYSLGQADLLRRAMGKKKISEMQKHREIFRQGAKELHGVPEPKADEIFDMMEKFAGYGFNRSHAAAYSVVAYQTAFLKARYPAEFMAAAMTNEMGSTEKLAIVLEEARRMEIAMLPPSVNFSQAHFTVEHGQIRFGLGAIKGVGLGAIEALVVSREKHGPFRTVFHMTKELDLRAIGKKALESLARAGAMDDLEGHRAQLVEAIDLAVQYAQKIQADRAAGQSSLFGEMGNASSMEPNLPMVEPWPKSRLLKEERELMGFYISGHPLEAFLAEYRAFTTAQLGHVEEDVEAVPVESDRGEHGRNGAPRKPQHRFCGIITEVQRRTSKTGKPLAFATIEDFSGQGEIVCFSSVYDRVQNYLKVDEIVLVKGEVEIRGGAVKILAQDVIPMWKVREQMVKAIVLRVNMDRVQTDQIDKLQTLCESNRGTCKLYFEVEAGDLPTGPQRIRSRRYVIDPTPELMLGMQRLFGRENVLLEGEA